MTSIGQRMSQRANKKPPHQTGIAEPDFRLGRMDVHINSFRVEIHKQRRHRVAVTREEILIGRADDAG